VSRVVHHERKDGRVVPTGKPAEPPLSPREAARKWYALQGWPPHRVAERLARDFPPPEPRHRR
jgi:hypothetical protein